MCVCTAALEGLKQELVVERRGREEAVTSKQSVEIKSKLFIASQQQQMEALNKAKESAEQQVRDLQRQLSQLKHQLSHTEETQKDFVELSQSLQVCTYIYVPSTSNYIMIEGYYVYVCVMITCVLPMLLCRCGWLRLRTSKIQFLPVQHEDNTI